MEPITNSLPSMLVLPTALELIEDDSQGILIPAELRYDCSDPYAVSIAFGGGECTNVWTFARELLMDGLREPTGDGDVHVWPGVTDAGDAVVLLELISNDQDAVLAASPSEVLAFLAKSHEFVPAGQESEHCDLDSVIAAIFAGVRESSSDE